MMKPKYIISYTCLLLFLLCAAMTCDGDYEHPVTPVDFVVGHVNNTGEKPVDARSDEHISKDAYVLKIDLKFADGSEEFISPDYDCRLQDPITHIRVASLTEEAGEEKEEDVTAFFRCFQIVNSPNYYDIVPLPMENIDRVVNSTLYIALYDFRGNNHLLPGIYRFKVDITLESGEVLGHIAESVTLF